MADRPLRVAFDIGGTFTDVIALDAENRVLTAKVLSLLHRVGEDIVACAKRMPAAERIDYFAHATTICSNAVIENQAATTGFLTTQGFRDTLELRGQKGPEDPDIDWAPPAPLIPRDLCLEVQERMRADGTVLTALDEDDARAAIQRLVERGVRSIAVGLINAHVNGSHETRLAGLIHELAPGMPVSLSAEIHPEIREYERFSTTAINAKLVPVVTEYLDRLQDQLSVFTRRLVIMQSNGGLMSAEAARRRPALMVESGPAAGVLAAARLATGLGLDKVISFDMGGTTAKACLIRNGVPLERSGGEVGGATTAAGTAKDIGHALRAPTIDLVEVGAGGGSIAWVDRGILRVGPRSAGAEPGPICYGRGGTQPTVTDANVALGIMNPAAIAGGALAIDRAAALAGLRQLGSALSLDAMPLAYGITQVANAVMMRAIRAVSVERGYDAREFTLMAFGGSGPLHAVALAENMGIRRVVVPPFPGLFSALGLMLADYRIDSLLSLNEALATTDVDRVLAHFTAMEERLRSDMQSQGMPTTALRFERRIDLRYDFQLEEMTLDIDPDLAGEALKTKMRTAFESAHEREFGTRGHGRIILANLRLRGVAPGSGVRFAELKPHGTETAFEHGRTRDVYFGPEHGTLATPIHSRASLSGCLPGPIIIEEPDTTIVVRPGWKVERDAQTNVILTRETSD